MPKLVVRVTYKKLEILTLDERFNEIFKVKIVENGEFSINIKI